MEAVIFDGKEYVKASVLAKKFRYTADYLGQLCRGKKVDARLVGRAWYINLESLSGHRDGRYKTVSVKNDESPVSISITKKQTRNYLSRIEVEPILKKKTVSIFKSKNGDLSEFPVKYESDDYSLIPRVNRAAVSKNIPITPAGAEKLTVHKEGSAVTDFRAEALPEVFLRGTLKVNGLEEATESVPEEESKVEPEIKSERKLELEKPKPIIVRPIKKRPAPITTPVVMSRSAEITIPVKVSSEMTKTDVMAWVPEIKLQLTESGRSTKVLKRPERSGLAPKPAQSPKVPVMLAPAASLNVPPSFKPRLVVKKEEKQVTKVKKGPSWIFPILIFFSACALAVFLIVLNVEILATQSSYHLKFLLDWSQLGVAVSHLKNL